MAINGPYAWKNVKFVGKNSGEGRIRTCERRLLESGSLVEIIEILGQQNLEVVVDGLYSAQTTH